MKNQFVYILIHQLKLQTTKFKQLQILYKNCLDKCFLKTWKKTSIVPIHKKVITN